jgi:hypothetical protein
VRRLARQIRAVLPVPSLLLSAAAIALGAWAVWAAFAPPPSHPGRLRIQLPLPADCENWLALSGGYVELWEYTSWDQRWYPMSGFGAWLIPASLLVVIRGFSLVSQRVFRDGQVPQPPAARLRCGYNLTGNVSGVCPECGRPVEEAA